MIHFFNTLHLVNRNLLLYMATTSVRRLPMQIVILLMVVALFVAGCGRSSAPSRDAVTQAVEATLTAQPMAIPYTLVVVPTVAIATATPKAIPTDVPTPQLPSVAPTATSTVDNLSDIEARLVERINQERILHALKPLRLIDPLRRAARHHSTYMAITNKLSHKGENGSTYKERIQHAGYGPMEGAEEAIGWGFASPDEAVTWWLGSDTHRKILLSRSYQEIGVGYTYQEEAELRHFWVVTVGSRAGAVALPIEQPAHISIEPTGDSVSQPPVEESPLPVVHGPATGTANCPTASTQQYATISMTGSDRNHPDRLHGDLNLMQRGYVATIAALHPIDISGPTDHGAPRLTTIFEQNRTPHVTAAYRVHEWNWDCGDHGCQSHPLNEPEVTLLGMASTPNEALYAPRRQAEIYGGGYIAAVLYAESRQITLAYTRDGSVVNGYTVHMENLCVDPNLVAAYQQANAAGRGALPAVHADDRVGTALSTEVRVAIRDRGRFMDPRSRKDWWQ